MPDDKKPTQLFDTVIKLSDEKFGQLATEIQQQKAELYALMRSADKQFSCEKGDDV